jgi:hypothetical protein
MTKKNWIFFTVMQIIKLYIYENRLFLYDLG